MEQGVAQRIQMASQKAVSYLEREVAMFADNYALAIVSYCLALAKSRFAGPAFARLSNDVIVKGKIRDL